MAISERMTTQPTRGQPKLGAQGRSDYSRFSNASRFREEIGKNKFLNPIKKRIERTNQSRFKREEDPERGDGVDGGFGVAARKDFLSPCGEEERFLIIYMVVLLRFSQGTAICTAPSPVTIQSNHELSFIVPVDVSCRLSRRRLACEFARILTGYSQAALSIY
ncbi:hypothetical protein Csa_018717 [Cucumis sativus]|uniref:Uncharacterized protein n=1 Tax=Cucumis sativus TaxID=3659 RepID=A0A0A0LN05_CUCSA|nr:hypothetical protein Csa_018717 [Cucumis sativus]